MNLISGKSYTIKAPIGDVTAVFNAVEVDTFTGELALIFIVDHHRKCNIPIVDGKPKFEISPITKSGEYTELIPGEAYEVRYINCSMKMIYKQTKIAYVNVQLVFENCGEEYIIDAQKTYVTDDGIIIADVELCRI